MPPAVIAALTLPFRRRGRALLAEASVIWDGIPRRVSVAAADADPLVGMALLEGYELTVQATDGGSVFIEELASP